MQAVIDDPHIEVVTREDPDDRELLSRYVQHHSHAAFARLVERHVAMVHAAVRRQLRGGTGDGAMQAEDVVQAVFILLARKAAAIGPRVSLGGWLYNAARMTAANARRAATRRRHYEHQAGEAMRRAYPNGGGGGGGGGGDHVNSLAWSDVEDKLDVALARLRPRDREALVLRFLSARSMREVGDAAGISEDAARVRVNRALERLRRLMGVTAPVSALTVALDAGGVAAAAATPAHLAPTVAAAALAPAAGSSAAALATATATVTPVAAKVVVAAVAAVLVIGVPVAFVALSGPSRQPVASGDRATGSVAPQAPATPTTGPAAADVPANGPRGVTLRLIRAAATADRATMRAAMHIENDVEARAADTAVELLVAEARLEATASARFPDEAAATRLDKKLAQITGATESFNGDRASLTFAGQPPLNAFVRHGGQWKLIPSVALLERDAPDRLDARIAETNATRAAMDATAAEIDAGHFRTRAEADAALVGRLTQLRATTGPAAAAAAAERAAANPAPPRGR
jgi:RNA polymerase sigma factor (sigma-70 family)